MADFTSSFWNLYIIIPTIGGIIACFFLVRWLSGGNVKSGEKVESMGHVWDENLEELNNPLPSWWLKLFYITLVFGLVYLVLYPGLGSFPGLLDWTSTGQYQREVDIADASYGPLFTKYREMPIVAVAADPKPTRWVNGCSSITVPSVTVMPAGRAVPNLRDNDWL
jgi:cytochrome c oxidase cbb3-type subunit 3